MEEARGQKSESSAGYDATPRGKIGRLKHELREQVNTMLRDNAEAAEIIAHLEANGIHGITPQNISNWKANGYEKWLRNQDRIDGIRANIDFAQSLIASEKSEGIDGLTMASDAASRVALSQIMTVLENFDISSLTDALHEKPAKFIELIHAISSIRQRDQAGTALAMKVRQFEEAAKKLKDVIDENGVATAEDFNAIYRDAYGIKEPAKT